MKKSLLIAGSVVVLIALLGLVGLLALDHIASAAIERGGTSALGVPVLVETVDIGLLAGKVELAGLSVANPPGFKSSKFADLHEGHLRVELGSLRQDVVRAPQLVLDGVTLNVERAGAQLNYLPILEHIKQREAKRPDDGGKKFIVQEVLIRNVEAHLDLVPEGGELTRATVHIPEVRLQDVGTSDNAASIGTLIETVVKALLNATIQSSAQSLPNELLADLQQSIQSLKGQAIELREGVSTAIEKLGGEADRAVDEIKKRLPQKKD